jgi:hypothetical protein
VEIGLATDAPQDLARTSRRALWLAVPAAIGVGVLLGWLGWALLVPGESLVIPSLLVLGTGAVVALSSGIFGMRRPLRRWIRVFAKATVACSIAAAIWTFQFALPSSIAWDSGVTARAQAVLADLSVSARTHHGVAPLEPCSIHRSGSVGPLNAPYKECAIWTTEGHFVTFTTLGPRTARGLGFTNAGAPTFPDECARHLVGQWWMFTEPPNSSVSPGGCPIGYHFQGGG